jgi:hypothetical protein
MEEGFFFFFCASMKSRHRSFFLYLENKTIFFPYLKIFHNNFLNFFFKL